MDNNDTPVEDTSLFAALDAVIPAGPISLNADTVIVPADRIQTDGSERPLFAQTPEAIAEFVEIVKEMSGTQQVFTQEFRILDTRSGQPVGPFRFSVRVASSLPFREFGSEVRSAEVMIDRTSDDGVAVEPNTDIAKGLVSAAGELRADLTEAGFVAVEVSTDDQDVAELLWRQTGIQPTGATIVDGKPMMPSGIEGTLAELRNYEDPNAAFQEHLADLRDDLNEMQHEFGDDPQVAQGLNVLKLELALYGSATTVDELTQRAAEVSNALPVRWRLEYKNGFDELEAQAIAQADDYLEELDSNSFVSANGGRIYRDLDPLLEFATPEPVEKPKDF